MAAGVIAERRGGIWFQGEVDHVTGGADGRSGAHFNGGQRSACHDRVVDGGGRGRRGGRGCPGVAAAVALAVAAGVARWGGRAGGGEGHDTVRPGCGGPVIGLDDGAFGQLRAAQVDEFKHAGLLQGATTWSELVRPGNCAIMRLGGALCMTTSLTPRALARFIRICCSVDRSVVLTVVVVGRSACSSTCRPPRRSRPSWMGTFVSIQCFAVKWVRDDDLLAQIHPGGKSHQQEDDH